MKQSGWLPELISIEDIKYIGNTGYGIAGGSSSDGVEHVVQLMTANKVVWHKSCRSSVDSEKKKNKGPGKEKMKVP